MIKHLRKVGNSNALILERPVMEMIGLRENAEVQLTVHDGSLLVTPVNPDRVDPKRFEAALDKVIKNRRKVLRRLAL